MPVRAVGPPPNVVRRLLIVTVASACAVVAQPLAHSAPPEPPVPPPATVATVVLPPLGGSQSSEPPPDSDAAAEQQPRERDKKKRAETHKPKHAKHAKQSHKAPHERRTTRHHRDRSDRPTSWSALNRAIARIPHYRPGRVRWVVGHTGGTWWGTTDWYRGRIYINPYTPRDRLYDVVVHEWGHMLSVRAYGGDVHKAVRKMRHVFGGDRLGPERAADCIALELGAHWTNYTSCTSDRWWHQAWRLANGRALR